MQPGAAVSPIRLVYRDVVVSPFDELLEASSGGSDHRGGPAWPDWEHQTVARHLRREVPVDDEPEHQGPVDHVDGPLYWGGPVGHHYGHQIADFSMRLVSTLADDAGARIAFAAERRWHWGSFEDVPGHVSQIGEWLGVRPEARVLISRPTLVRELRVLPQAEQHHGPGPTTEHLERMDALVAERLPDRARPSGVLYVSRAAMHARLAGEQYLERAVRAAGATVVRPEEHDVASQLRAYVEAEALIFPEGSAVQSARLLGRDLGHVVVLLRRPGDRIAEDGLRPRSRSLAYRDALAGVVCGLDAGGELFQVLGLPVLDPERLLDALHDVLPGLRQAWDQAAWTHARDADVVAWLERSLDSPRVAGAASWAHILSSMESAGLGHLVPTARAMMSAHPQRET